MDDRAGQLERETSLRSRAAALSIAAGVLIFAGQVYNFSLTLKAPRVGLIQGLAPGLHGLKAAVQDPHSQSEFFTDDHAIGLILAIVVLAIGLALTAPILSYLYGAVKFRRPETSPVLGGIARYAPPIAAVFAIAAETSFVVAAHHFVTHADRSHHAIDVATKSTLEAVLGTIAGVSQYALAATLAMISYQAMRVGLLTRFLGVVGVIAGMLFIIPFTPLPVVQTFWFVGIGVVLGGYAQNELPPAWAAGEARPWPTQQELREARQAGGAGPGKSKPATSPPPPPTAPAKASPHASKKRKRRR